MLTRRAEVGIGKRIAEVKRGDGAGQQADRPFSMYPLMIGMPIAGRSTEWPLSGRALCCSTAACCRKILIFTLCHFFSLFTHFHSEYKS